MSRSTIDIDLLLQRMQHDLRRLPRHEWDGYLWQLCSQLVRATGPSGAELGTPAEQTSSDGEGNGPPF